MMETELGKACLVPLADGCFAKVSPRDHARVMQHKWVKVRPKRESFKVRMLRPHSQTAGRLVPGVALHRFVLEVEDGDYVSFRNKDGLDCRRGNLRVVYRTKPEPKVKLVAVKPEDRPKELPSPCGGMLSAKIATRCHGFQPGTQTETAYFQVGDIFLFKSEDGCPYYEQCLDAAAKEQWDGWQSIHGKVSTARWAQEDGLEVFLRAYRHQQKSGRYGT